jgi:hypothetical protein
VGVTVQLDSPGHVYWVVVPGGDRPPNAAQVLAGSAADGGLSLACGSVALLSPPYLGAIDITNRDYDTCGTMRTERYTGPTIPGIMEPDTFYGAGGEAAEGLFYGQALRNYLDVGGGLACAVCPSILPYTNYDLYAVPYDGSNAPSPPVRVDFRMAGVSGLLPGVMAPLTSNLRITDIIEDAYTLHVRSNRAGTLYWASARTPVDAGNTGAVLPSVAQVQSRTYPSAESYGSASLAQLTPSQIRVTGLPPGTTVDVHFFVVSTDGFQQSYVTTLSGTTLPVPNVLVSIAPADPAANYVNQPIPIVASFSVPVSGFSASGIIIDGGALLSGPSGNGAGPYSFVVDPTIEAGKVNVSLALGAASHAQYPSVPSSPSNLLVLDYTDARPNVSLSVVNDYLPTGVTVAATFSEIVTGFDPSFIVVTNGFYEAGSLSAADNSAGYSVFTFNVLANSTIGTDVSISPTLRIRLLAGATRDLAFKLSIDSNDLVLNRLGHNAGDTVRIAGYEVHTPRKLLKLLTCLLRIHSCSQISGFYNLYCARCCANRCRGVATCA